MISTGTQVETTGEGNIVAAGGGNIVAAGGGNVTASTGGSLALMTTALGNQFTAGGSTTVPIK